MRTADETLALFKKVMINRKKYVRKCLNEIPKPSGRSREYEYHSALRHGMLSELTTIEAVLKEIEVDEKDVEDWWIEKEDIE